MDEAQTMADAAAQAVADGPDAEKAARMLAEAAAAAPPVVVDQRPQTTYPSVAIDLLDPKQCPPGQRIMVIQNQQQVLLFPMSVEYAQQLGERLAAPSVAVARSEGDVKAAARAMGLPR